MKKYKIEFSQLALNDLYEIYLYISQELCSPQSAQDIYKKIEQKIESLSVLPFRNSEIISINGENIRRLIVDNYSILYYVNENSVIIFRIIYTASNLLEKFQAQ